MTAFRRLFKYIKGTMSRSLDSDVFLNNWLNSRANTEHFLTLLGHKYTLYIGK